MPARRRTLPRWRWSASRRRSCGPRPSSSICSSPRSSSSGSHAPATCRGAASSRCAIGSVPMAFLGGSVDLPGEVYRPLVAAVLLVGAWRLATAHRRSTDDEERPASRVLPGYWRGAAIGLLAGPDRHRRWHLPDAAARPRWHGPGPATPPGCRGRSSSSTRSPGWPGSLTGGADPAAALPLWIGVGGGRRAHRFVARCGPVQRAQPASGARLRPGACGRASSCSARDGGRRMAPMTATRSQRGSGVGPRQRARCAWSVPTPRCRSSRAATRRYVNLDYAASAPALQAVHDAVEELLGWYSSVHRGAGFKSRASTAAYEGARESIRRFVNGRDDDAVIITRNTTDSINLLAGTLPRGHPRRRLRRRAPRQPPAVEADRRAISAASPRRPPRCSSSSRRRCASCPHCEDPHLVAATGASNVTGEIWPLAEIARGRARVRCAAARRRGTAGAARADRHAARRHRLSSRCPATSCTRRTAPAR